MKADPFKELALLNYAIEETRHPLALSVLRSEHRFLAFQINKKDPKYAETAAEQARKVRHTWMCH